MPPEDDSPSLPPIPDYELLKLVGRGSYGDVWLARGATGLFRAVKIVWRERFTDIGPYEREFKGLSDFMRLTQGEARQLALLHVGRNEALGFFYYVMELADDVVTGSEIDPECYEPMTLRAVRAGDSFLPAHEALRHGIDLAQGLVELHAVGLIHRDIKPSNIILVDGRPKLADIGLVSVATEALTFVGTEGFVPPEGPGTRAADIFSLGKVLYEIATGCDRNDFPRLPTDFGQRADRLALLELNEIIVKACAHRASERYPDADTLLAELRLLEAGKSVRRLRFAEAGLTRARKWIFLAATIAIIAGAGAWFERRRANHESAGRRAAEAELAELTRRTLYDASLTQAQRALEAKDYGEARRALELAMPQPGEPDLRGFEWHALNHEAQGDPSVVLSTGGAPVTRLEESPDGRYLAIDRVDPTIEVVTSVTGEPIITLSNAHRLAGFSPDNARVVGSTPAYTLETWNIADGQPDRVPNKPGTNRPLQVHPTEPWLLYFEDSPDDGPHHLGIWNYDTGNIEYVWPVPQQDGAVRWAFAQANASTDLRTVMLCLFHGLGGPLSYRWEIIDMDTGQTIQTSPVSSGLRPVAISRDGKIRFEREANGTSLIAGNPKTAEVYWSRDLGIIDADHIVTSPDRDEILLRIVDNRTLAVNTQTGAVEYSWRGSAGPVDYHQFSQHDETIITSDRRGEVRRWFRQETQHSPRLLDLELPDQVKVKDLLVGDSGDSALILDTNQNGHWIDTGTMQRQHVLPGVRVPLWLEQNMLWTLREDCRLVRLSILSGDDVEFTPFGDSIPLVGGSISPNGRWLMVVSQDRRVAIWDRVKQHTLAVHLLSDVGLEQGELVVWKISNDLMVVSSDTEQNLKVWHALTKQIVSTVYRIDRVGEMTISPDFRWMISHGSAQRTRVLSLPDLESRFESTHAFGSGHDFAFHPTEPTYVACGARGQIDIIDLETGRAKTPLNFAATGSRLAQQAVIQFEFSPDGEALFATTDFGVLRVWRWSQKSDVSRLTPDSLEISN